MKTSLSLVLKNQWKSIEMLRQCVYCTVRKVETNFRVCSVEWSKASVIVQRMLLCLYNQLHSNRKQLIGGGSNINSCDMTLQYCFQVDNKLASLEATLVENYNESLTNWLTGIKCRATSVANKNETEIHWYMPHYLTRWRSSCSLWLWLYLLFFF